MLEIEIKAPCEDLGAAEKALTDLGGVFIVEVEQVDQYLAHPCRDFAATDEALRLRSSGGSTTLHYKGPKLDRVSKSREELSVEVPDPPAMVVLLGRLGFRPVAEVRKVRRTYRVADVEVALDRVAGLGGFVELEVQDLPLEEGRGKLFSLLGQLGLQRTERRSYLELLLEKA